VSEKISQLVEVVRACDEYILADGDFIAFTIYLTLNNTGFVGYRGNKLSGRLE
jgi:hypothetical protein